MFLQLQYQKASLHSIILHLLDEEIILSQVSLWLSHYSESLLLLMMKWFYFWLPPEISRLNFIPSLTVEMIWCFGGFPGLFPFLGHCKVRVCLVVSFSWHIRLVLYPNFMIIIAVFYFLAFFFIAMSYLPCTTRFWTNKRYPILPQKMIKKSTLPNPL